MKCLWKAIKFIPNWMKEGNFGLDRVLNECHEFLKQYPSTYWKKQTSDTPQRTIKTLLHCLVSNEGESILEVTSKISDAESSEMVPYVKKLVAQGVGKDNKKDQPVNNKKFSKSEHDALADIFKMIGNKEQTKQGLQELYNFKQQNPHANLEPFLSRSSQYFR